MELIKSVEHVVDDILKEGTGIVDRLIRIKDEFATSPRAQPMRLTQYELDNLDLFFPYRDKSQPLRPVGDLYWVPINVSIAASILWEYEAWYSTCTVTVHTCSQGGNVVE